LHLDQEFIPEMLDHKGVSNFIKKLNNLYKERLQKPNDLDERFFIELGQKLRTPIKLN
jgi:hypothetical protein